MLGSTGSAKSVVAGSSLVLEEPAKRKMRKTAMRAAAPNRKIPLDAKKVDSDRWD
jgi:hypothetical protein